MSCKTSTLGFNVFGNAIREPACPRLYCIESLNPERQTTFNFGVIRLDSIDNPTQRKSSCCLRWSRRSPRLRQNCRINHLFRHPTTRVSVGLLKLLESEYRSPDKSPFDHETRWSVRLTGFRCPGIAFFGQSIPLVSSNLRVLTQIMHWVIRTQFNNIRCAKNLRYPMYVVVQRNACC